MQDINELKTTVLSAAGGLGGYLETDQLDFAADQAVRELGFSFPVTNNTREYWLIERSKRHVLDVLRTASAYKFRYKQIYLNQRFEHLNTLLEKMDEEFKEALNNEPDLLGVDVSTTFGTYIENGFIYDQFGQDVSKVLVEEFGEDNDGYRERYV